MAKNRTLEQHIAVFGESGSGKTVLLSSFYGAAQEPAAIKRTGLHVVSDSDSQSKLLSQAFLGMKRSATVPQATRFSSTSYSFRVTMKQKAGVRESKRSSPFSALRLVWHDYPGEWFEQDVSGATESRRRVDTFRALLQSDVAILLVDSQKLIANTGHEERYLKSLIINFRTSLQRLQSALIDNDQGLVTFPRIWMFALSKSDLLPKMSVTEFRELMLEKVGDDIVELQEIVAGFIDSPDALSMGEDFVLLSSAKFGDNAIDVTTRVGVDLVLPIAAVLPFERHVRWAHTKKVGARVASELMSTVNAVAVAVGFVGRLASVAIGSKNRVLGSLGLMISRYGPDAVEIAAKKVKQAGAATSAAHESLASMLMGFNDNLERAERESILHRSVK